MPRTPIKLVKALFSVNRNRIDLLPFYARFIATIHPCAADISAAAFAVDAALWDFAASFTAPAVFVEAAASAAVVVAGLTAPVSGALDEAPAKAMAGVAASIIAAVG